ncbi:hypothetical protein [Sporosarcina ureae]|uniref:hypothetical protein n=1 Tax=Sporosarcina ureae TaxID=1571 RepID=UPI0026E929BE|nr:hypothetical protein [Sporosarcina ureae]
MKSFSMWEFTGLEDLNEAINLIRDSRPIITTEDWEDEPLIAVINQVNGFDINNPESLEVDGNQINYVIVDCITERSRNAQFWFSSQGQLRPREKRINVYQTKVLLFEYNNLVRGIVFTGKGRAGTIIRDCLPAEQWGNFAAVEATLTEDLLYWIFRKFIDLRESPLSPVHNLYVTALKSYTGKTRDNINAMRGNGRRISTILGTLAFLFNNENLKAVRPQLQYNGEVFLLEISLTGTCRIWEEEYQGIWLNLDEERLQNNIAIYTYIKLLPTLIDCYQDNIRRGSWSPQLKVEFLQRLGNEIKDQVEAELARLQEEAHLDEQTDGDGVDALDLFDITEEDDDDV